ncbi:MAG: D-glycerate dehydrogenase [Pseudomonadota bacterium]
MARPVALLTRAWPAAAIDALAAHFEVVAPGEDAPVAPDDLRAALGRCDALLSTVTDRLDAAALAGASRTRIIGNFGVGVSHIDLEAARAAGIAVTNTPDVLTDATADLAMTLLLMSARRVSEGEALVRSGRWSGWTPTQLLGSHVTGKTIGIVGMGRIGQATARRAQQGFGMRVLYTSRSGREVDLPGARRVPLEALLEEADFVSLHCPGGAENRHLVDAAALARMKPGAHLINTARGEVVDEAALVAALSKGVIAGAGLDVFEEEPKLHPGLSGLPNVSLLPHLGSATVETRVAMGLRVVENLVAFFEGRAPRDRVA